MMTNIELEKTIRTNYLTRAKRLSDFLNDNISIVMKFNLCVIQRYFIKRFLKKLKNIQ
jgi:hypothetical protein